MVKAECGHAAAPVTLRAADPTGGSRTLTPVPTVSGSLSTLAMHEFKGLARLLRLRPGSRLDDPGVVTRLSKATAFDDQGIQCGGGGVPPGIRASQSSSRLNARE